MLGYKVVLYFIMKRLLGAHVSIAGGLSNAIDNGIKLGCNVIQIFGSSPRSWKFKMPTAAELERFKVKRKESGIEDVFLHSIYLINLAATEKGIRGLAIVSLVNYLNLAEKIDCQGVITHIGTAAGVSEKDAMKHVVSSIDSIIKETKCSVPLILEVTAGAGDTIGSKYEHLAGIIDKVHDPSRIGVCWDTAHTFESGYDIVNNLDGVLQEFDKLVGLEKIKVVHFNDSKTKYDSKVDRHENLGEGRIGYKAMKKIINHPKLIHLPFIIETPGFHNEGPDKKNMYIMKKMAGVV